MSSNEWGVFRLRGVLSRKTFKARPISDDQWAVTERAQTGKAIKGGEHDTCFTQSLIPASEFCDHYIAVDLTAKQMLKPERERELDQHPSHAPTVFR